MKNKAADLAKQLAKGGYPRDEISCPECGYLYGHHNTLVDMESEFCLPCAKKRGFDNIDPVSAQVFIAYLLQ